MQALEDLVDTVPVADLDLTGCAALAAHGLPTPAVITLARRPERWTKALRELGQRGIDTAVKCVAVDGQALTLPQISALVVTPADIDEPPRAHLQLTRPAVGCFLSHLSLWKRFLQSGESRMLVLEDDAIPTEQFTAVRAQAMMAAIPPDADLVLLGCTIIDGMAEPADQLFSRVYYFNGTYAYLITRNGCLKLLSHMLPIRTHIDHQISHALIADRGSLHVYRTTPLLFTHDFTVWSDTYVPIAEVHDPDRALGIIFAEARAKLLREGVRLIDKTSQ